MTEDMIFETYSDMVYKVAFGYTKNSTDTDDVFQEVFLRYFKRPRIFTSEEHRKAWLIRVTINCAKDFLSGKSDHAPLEEISPSAASYVDNPDDGNTLNAINQLDSTSRNIIYMFYYEDMSVKQIAGALKMNENTVKTKLKRARNTLAGFLGDED